MDSCDIRLNPVEEKVKDLLGTSDLMYNCTSDAFANGYTQGFISWYEQFGEPIPEFTTTDPQEVEKLANRLVEYHNRIPAVGRETRPFKGQDKVALKGYPTINDREEGKRHAVGYILDIFANVSTAGTEIKESPKTFYLKSLKQTWNNVIVEEIARRHNMSLDDAKNELRRTAKEIKAKTSSYATLYEYFEARLGGKDKGVVATNLLALYKELNGSTADALAYMDELFGDKRLQFIRSEDDDSTDDKSKALMVNEANVESTVEIDDFSYSDTIDDSLAQYGSHQGLYNSFTMHLGEKLTIYFNSLERYIRTPENDTPIRDTNTRFGIPERMDASRVLGMLYAINSEFGTLESTIEAIKRVATRVDEFACFHKLAADLEADLDLATELRTVIAKTVVSKMQMQLANGDISANITNEQADRRATMLFNLFNDTRSSLPHADTAMVSARISAIKQEINSIKFNIKKNIRDGIDRRYEQCVEDTITLLRSFYGSIQPEAVQSYIDLTDAAWSDNTYDKKFKNLGVIISLIEATNDKVVDAKNKYAAAREEYSEKLEAFNAANNKAGVESAQIPFERPTLTITDFVAGNTGNCNAAIEMFMPYSVIKLQLNHPNAMGNNASDVINNNYLTRLENIFRQNYKDDKGNLRNDALESWGKARIKSRQYKYSSILLEQRDGKGNLINHGIFKITPDGTLCLTKESSELLKIYLFDGSRNLDGDKSAPYSEMGEGGYLPTAFMAFFQPEEIYKGSVKLANYFFRTPADASKNFIMRSSKIDITGLLSPISSGDNEASRYIESIRLLTDEEKAKYLSAEPAKYGPKVEEEQDLDRRKRATINTIVDGIIKGTMPVQEGSYITTDDGTYLSVYLQGNKTQPAKVYLFKGNLKKSATSGNDYLGDAQLIGFRNYKSDITTGRDTITKELDDKIRSRFNDILEHSNLTINGVTYNKIKYKVNRNHQMFKVLRNIFKQEMLNCARAIDYYFETNDTGWVKDADKVKKEIDKVIRIKESVKGRGYRFYHGDGKENVLINRGDGEYELPGLAFHSNRFMLAVTDDNGEVKKRNYLDELIGIGYSEAVKEDRPFQLLYGGSEDKKGSYLHVIKRKAGEKDAYDTEETKGVEGEVLDVDIDSNEYQRESVNDKIEEFIQEFVSQALDKISAKKQFMADNVVINAITCADFALNNFVHLCQSDDLFEGDTKFYADARTILKRAKEIQGSGVPYGISDYLTEDTGIPETIKNGYLTQLTTQRKDKDGNIIEPLFKGTILEGITQRTKFYGVTVANTQMTNTVALERLEKYLVKQMDDEASINHPSATDKDKERIHNANVEHVKELLYGPLQKDKDGKLVRRGGFTETKVNDAQSYITMQEWVRRIANKGQLKKYLPLINKILDDSYVLKDKYRDKDNNEGRISREEYKALTDEEKEKYREKTPLTTKDLKEFVQVQKNFYYDMWWDEEFEMFVPRHIKNAEFVLVPRLIEGTELEEVYNIMVKKGIDQLNTIETSKAANREIITLWDNAGNFDTTDFLANADRLKMTYDYKYLYTQQETSQHINSENKAAIQFVKKIVDNIPPGHKLYDKKQEYLKLLAYNVEDSFRSLMKEFGVTLDDSGNIPVGNFELDFKKFAQKFKDEMLRLGADSNMMDYFTYDDTGSPLMYPYINTALRKLESVAQSLFNNNITRQKLPGFHVAQVTNIGWSPLSSQVSTRSYDKNLEYHPNEYVNINNEKDVIIQREYNKLSEEDKKKYKYKGVSACIEIMLPKGNFGIDMNSEHYKNMNDDEILAELKKKGLDTLIGYRIPTEGKQSMCVMKVVGFTNDANGSTIVVPNDWVSQTGSDFDIDSVYGVQFPTRTLNNGEVIKVNYISDPTYGNWIAYLHKKLKQGVTSETLQNELNRDVNAEIDNKIKQAKAAYKALEEELDTDFKTLQKEESEYYHNLHELIQEELKKRDAKITAAHRAEIAARRNSKSIYLERLAQYKEVLNSEVSRNTKRYQKGKENIDKLLDTITKIEEHVNTLEDKLKYDRVDAKGISDEHKAELANLAKDAGLMTYEEYKATVTANPNEYNSKKARQSRVCQLMLDILSDPTSLEENLSRSTSDDSIYWRDLLISENDANARAYRSAYNIFDQIAYQEDATSGLALKGLSVSLDTFCSICNTVRPTLTKPIAIIYDDDDFGHPAKKEGELGSKYGETAKEVCERLGVSYEETLNGGFIIRHDQYGWTNDNKNVANKILTSYSSQTTALILDAIKEGGIPGVNIYTFPAYKTLVNVGSDYKTAVSFIMQPGIKRIVANHEATNSVFSSNFGNPIHKTIRDIAKELGVPFKNTDRIQTVLKEINKRYGDEIQRVFSYGKDVETHITFSIMDKSAANIPINVKLQAQRLKGEGIFANPSPVEGDTSGRTIGQLNALIFDLGTVLIFNRLNNIATNVSSIARVCNPDKFGAKQTVFATNRVFEDIRDITSTDNAKENPEYDEDGNIDLAATAKRKPILTVNGAHIVESIYPGIFEGTQEDPIAGMRNRAATESSYPPLFNYLKYASASSILINRKIFDTQSINFVNAVNGIATRLSGRTKKLDEATYYKVQEYLLSRLYNRIAILSNPVTISTDNSGNPTIKITHRKEVEEDNNFLVDEEPLRVQERNRIAGFNYPPNLDVEVRRAPTEDELKANPKLTEVVEYKPFVVGNINKPTKKEIDEFATLSPGQKIKWIKDNVEDKGIFEYVDVTLFNPSNRGNKAGMHTLEYKEDTISAEVGYYLFNQAFYDVNPLFQLAAIDMIKYAYLIEGGRMSSRGILKLISNVPIYTELGINGTGIMGAMKNLMTGIREGLETETFFGEGLDTIYEDYIRSHPDMQGIRTMYINDDEERTNKYGLTVPKNNATPIFISDPELKENSNNDADISKKNDEALKAHRERLAAMGIVYSTEDSDYALSETSVTEAGVNRKNIAPYNSYVRMKIGKEQRLYRIVYVPGRGTILYPLNKLEPFEHTVWSARESNNVAGEARYYKALINQFISQSEQNHFMVALAKLASKAIAQDPTLKDSFYKSRNRAGINKSTVSFNLEDLAKDSPYSGAANSLLVTIRDHFRLPSAAPITVMNRALGNFIFSPGIDYRSIQEVTINGVKTKIAIEKLNPSNYDSILAKGQSAINSIKNKDLRDLLTQLKSQRLRADDLYQIYRVETPASTTEVKNEITSNDVMESSFLDDASVSVVRYVNRTANKGDSIAGKSSYEFRVRGITGKDGNLTEDKKLTIYRELARYSQEKATELQDTFNYFDDGQSMLSEHVIDLLNAKIPAFAPQQRAIETRYIKTINEVRALMELLAPYKSDVSDEESDDVRFYIGKIQEALGVLERLNIEEAAHTYNEHYLKNLSNDPIVKSNLMKVMDSYYLTHGSMWQFNDILESANPLLQIVLKDVMADLEGKRQQATLLKRKLHKQLADIKKRAAEDGVEINLDNIIDGATLRQAYSSELSTRLKELIANRAEMAANYGEGSYQHLKADLEYTKFLSTHFHQEALPDYYTRKIAILEDLLNPKHRVKYAYVNYMKLQYRRRSITRYKSPSEYTEEDRKELARIDELMYALRAPHQNIPILDETRLDGRRPNATKPIPDTINEIDTANIEYDIEDLFKIDNLNNDARTLMLRKIRRVVFDYQAALKLNKSLEDLDKLDEEYYTYEGKDYFEEQLEKNLRIIEQAEQRGPNGRPTATFEELSNNPSYQRARKWINENAKFELYNQDRDNPGSLGFLIDQALKRMNMRSNGSKAIKLPKALEKKIKLLRDADGAVDVSKFTDEDWESYAKAVFATMYNNEAGLSIPFDRVLLNSVTPKLDDYGNPIRYSKTFYNQLFAIPAKKAPEYFATITEINRILAKYYDSETNIVRLNNIPDTAEGIAELNKLADLYSKLSELGKEGRGSINKKLVERGIDTNTEKEVYNELARPLRKIVKVGDNEEVEYTVSPEYLQAWKRVNYETNEDGTPALDAEGEPKLNRYLYGKFVIKDSVLKKHPEFIDKQFEADAALINDTFINRPTKYWYAALAEARRQAAADPSFDLQGWINSNYYFNTNTRKFELLPIWTTTEVNPKLYDNETYKQRWVPKGRNRTRRVNDGWRIAKSGRKYYDSTKDKVNSHYKKDGTLEENYIAGSDGGKYDNKVEMNTYEKEIHKLFKDILLVTAKTNDAKRYYAEGRMPTRKRASSTKLTDKAIKLVKDRFIPGDAKTVEEVTRDMAKKRKIKFRTDSEVEYLLDYNLDVPMMQLLSDKELGSVDFTEPEPKRSSYPDTPEGYQQYLVDHNNWQTQKDEVTAKNKEVAKAISDKDWVGVMDEYIDRVGNYNAIIENKDRLYYLLDSLKRQQSYIRQHGYYGDIKRRGADGPFITTVDNSLIAHYKDFLKRLLFDEWKEDNGVLTIAGKHLQSYASANYMMLNFRAGVANITLGSWGMISEAAAGEYLGYGSLRAGTVEYRKGLTGIIRKAYDADSVNVQDAIIKFFKVVDYDEVAGRAEPMNYSTWFKRLTNSMYLPQTGGEHFMQNSVLFAMLKSHKLVDIPNDSKGIGTTFMNQEEYISYKEHEELLSILTPEERASYDQFMNEIKSDPNITKDYVWRQKDALTEWLYFHYPDDKRKEFLKRRKELRKEYIDEFNSFTNIFDQLELADDGFLGFKEGSKLAELHKKYTADGQMTQAMAITGAFSQRVKSVNNKIHGVYNKLGRAYIEHHWIGGLIMQYHKHLPMGILKRYRIQGYYNEARGTVEKGIAKTLWDAFLNPYSLNNRKVQQRLGWNKDEVGAVQGLFFHLRHTIDYLLQIRDTYATLPEYERANIRRNIGDAGAVLTGMTFTFALLMLGGGDDNDSIAYNFALYEADRLASEGFLYNPLGMYSEGKTLMSTPIAAQSIVSDLLKGCWNILGMIFGDDEDTYYKSGRFSGRSKLSVYFERRIPVWYGIRGVIETPDNNHYYKVGSTGLKPTIPVRWIAEGILGKEL